MNAIYVVQMTKPKSVSDLNQIQVCDLLGKAFYSLNVVAFVLICPLEILCLAVYLFRSVPVGSKIRLVLR